MEVKKTEAYAQLESKLTAAEQNREKEILRKLEAVKKCVIIHSLFISIVTFVDFSNVTYIQFKRNCRTHWYYVFRFNNYCCQLAMFQCFRFYLIF